MIVLTLDEEIHLRRCLASVCKIAREIFVVDSGSVDGTCRIARSFGAHVVEHPFRSQADQFNWALDNLPVRTDWILRLDADEYLLPETRREIAVALARPPDGVAGFYMKRRIRFAGRWIRHGGVYPTWFLRLFRRGKGRSEPREMDEHIVLAGGDAERLEHDFVNDNREGFRPWLYKHVGYARREAVALRRSSGRCEETDAPGALIPGPRSENPVARRRWWKERVYLRTPPFLRAFLYFGYRYVVRGGFLDGVRGFVFHFFQGLIYRLCVDCQALKDRIRSHRGYGEVVE